MKKSLFLVALAGFAFAANAQTVVGLATGEELEAAGLASTKVDKDPMTILENEAGTFGLAYKDSWGTTTTYKNYRNVVVGGEEIELGSGAVGNTNPTFVSYQQGVMSAGAVFKITSKKDGWMTVFTKMNPNKQYLVFEGETGALAFTLGYSNGTENIYYTVPAYTDGDDEGMIDYAEAAKYLVVATKQSKNAAGELLWKDKDGNVVAGERPKWTVQEEQKDGTIKDVEKQGAAVMEDIPGENKPQFPYLAAGLEKAPGESTGFLTFKVYEDTDYYFSALGSKAACGGFVFTEEQPEIVFKATDDLPEVTFTPGKAPEAGVESIAVELDENAPIYNTLGVRVDANAKGILIQNGKKFIRK